MGVLEPFGVNVGSGNCIVSGMSASPCSAIYESISVIVSVDNSSASGLRIPLSLEAPSDNERLAEEVEASDCIDCDRCLLRLDGIEFESRGFNEGESAGEGRPCITGEDSV